MGGVDHQVQHHPVDVGRQAADGRQIGVEIRHHVGHVFPFVAAERERAFDRVVQIDRLLSSRVGVGKLLHGADDAGHVLHAFQRLLDGLGDFAP